MVNAAIKARSGTYKPFSCNPVANQALSRAILNVSGLTTPLLCSGYLLSPPPPPSRTKEVITYLLLSRQEAGARRGGGQVR